MTVDSTPERYDRPGLHDGWHVDATEAFVIISDLKAEIVALKAEIDRLRVLAVEERAQGFKDGIAEGGNV